MLYVERIEALHVVLEVLRIVRMGVVHILTVEVPHIARIEMLQLAGHTIL